MKIASRLVLLITLLFYIIHLLFAWMNNTIDTGYYHAFAQYIRTGTYIWHIGLPYTTVHTGAGPLFSILLAVLYDFERSDIILHCLQLLMMDIISVLLYKMLRSVLTKEWAIIVTCLHALIPGNPVFISYVLTDFGGQFFFMIYTYILFRYWRSSKPVYLALSVLIGCICGLWRFSFLFYALFSLALFLWKHPKGIQNYMLVALGVSMIVIWVYFVHQVTGIWGVSDDPGIRYSNKMLTQAKRVPSETNPAVIEIRKYVPAEVSLARPYWELEPYLVPYIGYDYIKLTQLVGNVGKAALYEYPLDYLRVTGESFFGSHIGVPYYSNLSTFGLNVPRKDGLYCDPMFTVHFCEPLIQTPLNFPVWNAYIQLSNWFYTTIFPLVSFGIFFPLLLWNIVSGEKVPRLFAFLFLLGRVTIAMTTETDPRYMIPYYPLMVLIITYGLASILPKLKNKPLLNKET